MKLVMAVATRSGRKHLTTNIFWKGNLSREDQSKGNFSASGVM
jgi:hypothetical protein